METRPWAWVFFVPFILVVTFAVLNLFVAVIVGAMQAGHDAETVRAEEQTQADYRALVAEVRGLRAELAARLPGDRPAG
jgi:voltage-gated sodium channel